MKTFKSWMVIPTALAMLLTSAGVTRSETLKITPGFEPNPLVVNGTSGGTRTTKSCGQVGKTPNHVLQLNSDVDYLRLRLQGSGQPTLLIEESNGKSSCVPADRFSAGVIESPGYWQKGTYSIYIGDLAGGQHNYTLSISRSRN
jgi:hypothetical protein